MGLTVLGKRVQSIVGYWVLGFIGLRVQGLRL